MSIYRKRAENYRRISVKMMYKKTKKRADSVQEVISIKNSQPNKNVIGHKTIDTIGRSKTERAGFGKRLKDNPARTHKQQPVEQQPKPIKVESQEQPMNTDRCYVIDTNIFMHHLYVLPKIGTNNLMIIPSIVLNELNNNEKTSQNAEKALMLIKKNSNKNIIIENENLALLPGHFDKCKNDNRILSVALNHKDDNVVLLTFDKELRQKAKKMKINT